MGKQTHNEEHSGWGDMQHVLLKITMKDKERSRDVSRLKETKKIGQLNAVCDPSIDTVLKQKEMLKDITGSTKKTGIQMKLEKGNVSILTLLTFITVM